ncbi:hypothetical protein OAO10_02605, partial [Luminiphilus sp.]|nr:hypothetical protein [Luminiphilus sp.]
DEVVDRQKGQSQGVVQGATSRNTVEESPDTPEQNSSAVSLDTWSIERELVENIGVVAMVCQYGFCVLYGWDVSVWSAPLLFALGIISTQIYVLLIGLISPGDRKVLWILGSVSILPIVFLIGSKLTWLGFFPENGFAAY